MSGFSFVEPEALDQINFLIKQLPGPEQLNKIGLDPRETSRVKQQVGEIMKMIDIYGVKNFEYKTRYKAIKNLPPRYKVVDWNKSKKATASTVNGLIKASAVLKEKGKEKISERVMLLAEKIRSSDMSEDDVIKLANELRDGGFGIESFILKKNIKTAADDVNTTDDIWQAGTGSNYIAAVGEITTELENLKKYTEELKKGSKTQSIIVKLNTLMGQLQAAITEWGNFTESAQGLASNADLAFSQVSQSTQATSFRIDEIRKEAQTPAITTTDGEQLIGGQPVWQNIRALLGGLKSILATDAWGKGESDKYLKFVKSISDKMQNLKDMTMQLSSSKIPEIRDFMGSLVAEISDAADSWNEFVNQANGETPKLDNIPEQKEIAKTYLNNQGIMVNPPPA